MICIFFLTLLVFMKQTLNVWTSGTNDGIGCLKEYGWCSPEGSSGMFNISDLKWATGEKINPAGENGVVLQIGTGTVANTLLMDFPVQAPLNYICEVKNYSYHNLFKTNLADVG